LASEAGQGFNGQVTHFSLYFFSKKTTFFLCSRENFRATAATVTAHHPHGMRADVTTYVS